MTISIMPNMITIGDINVALVDILTILQLYMIGKNVYDKQYMSMCFFNSLKNIDYDFADNSLERIDLYIKQIFMTHENYSPKDKDVYKFMDRVILVQNKIDVAKGSQNSADIKKAQDMAYEIYSTLLGKSDYIYKPHPLLIFVSLIAILILSYCYYVMIG